MCLCSRFEHVLVFTWDDGNFCFLQVPCLWQGISIVFKQEGYVMRSHGTIAWDYSIYAVIGKPAYQATNLSATLAQLRIQNQAF